MTARSAPLTYASPEAMRQAREALGLTQEQLGEALGLTRWTITRCETGYAPITRPVALLLEIWRAAPHLVPRAGSTPGRVFEAPQREQ